MAVMLSLGRLRQNGESEASKGYRPVSKKATDTLTNGKTSASLAAWGLQEKSGNRGGRRPRVGQSLRLAVRCLWIALIQNSSNKAVVAGPGRQAPKAGGERVGRSRERKAKW